MLCKLHLDITVCPAARVILHILRSVSWLFERSKAPMLILCNCQTRNCEEQKQNNFHKISCENNWAENYFMVIQTEILIETDRDALGEQLFLIVPTCFLVHPPVAGLPAEPTNKNLR